MSRPSFGFAAAGVGLCCVWLVQCGGCEDDGPSGTPIVKQIEREEELIGGVEANGRVGDYLLANDKARFIVQAAGSATGWGIYGGALVDAAGPTGAPASDRLQEMFVQCDLRAFNPQSAEIVSDGRDGSAGILRLVGADAGIPFLDAIIVRDPLQVKMTVDYVLEPGSDTLEIRISVKDQRLLEAREISCGLVMLAGDQSKIFLEGVGNQPDKTGGEQSYIASAAYDAPQSWVLYKQGGPLNVILAQLEIVPIGPRPVDFLANATIEERYLVSVGGRGDIESALAAMRAHNGEPSPGRSVALTLHKPAALPLSLERAVVTVSRLEGERVVPITAAKADAQGVARFEAAAGTYRFELELDDRAVESYEQTIDSGDGVLELEHMLTGLGWVHVRTTELGLDGAELGPTPARAFVIAGADRPLGAPEAHEAYLEADEGFFMPAGAYSLWISRGPAHEAFHQNIAVVAGEIVEVAASVLRVVDQGDWITADLHVHGTKSADSQVAQRLRVLGAVAEGLDILISTDHDTVSDYAPVARALGLSGRLRTVVGCEMSMLYGHMNGWPLLLPDGREAHWSPSWPVYENGRYVRQLEPIEVGAALREKGAEIVQINHPRDGQGVFGFIGLDPDTGETIKPWPEADTVELLNGKRIEDYPAVIRDYVSQIKKGRRLTGVGSSDAHGVFSGQGYARTLIQGPGGALDDTNLSQVWRALREGRAVAMNGPFVFVSAHAAGNTVGLGDTLAASGPIGIDVRVEAASHIKVDRLILFENGVPIRERPIRPADADSARPALRFMGTLTATPAADAFYMIEVRGGDNAPFFHDSVSVTNPIFVDVDGNGLSFH